MYGEPDFATPLQQIVFWRGAFIHYYTIVEHATDDLLLRALISDHYSGFAKVPGGWPNRLTLLGKLFDAPGVLQRFAPPWRKALVALTIEQKTRHLLAHGMFASELSEDKQLTLTFTAYNFSKRRREVLTTTVEKLRHLVTTFGEAAEAYNALIAGIAQSAGLEPFPVGPSQPYEGSPELFELVER